MPSKWSKLKDKLDPWKPEPIYQERVEEAKKAYVALSPVELARELKTYGDDKDVLEAQIKEINLETEAISQLIVSALESSDIQALELESGMKVGLDISPYVSVVKTIEALAEYDKWIHSSKIKKLLTLNAKTRDGLIKEDLELGRPTPAWAKVYIKTKAKLYGRKKENSNGGSEDE